MKFVFVCSADELQSCRVRRGTKLIRPAVPRGFTRATRPASRENPCSAKEEVTRAHAALKEVFPKRFVQRHLTWRRQQLCPIYTPLRRSSVTQIQIRNEEVSPVWHASYFRQF